MAPMTLQGDNMVASYVIEALEWLKQITIPNYSGTRPKKPEIPTENAKFVGWLASHAYNGICRPDSLPHESTARQVFISRFAAVPLKTLGLQLSEDTVAKVNGRVARSFEDAVGDLSGNLARLKTEFRKIGEEGTASDGS